MTATIIVPWLECAQLLADQGIDLIHETFKNTHSPTVVDLMVFLFMLGNYENASKCQVISSLHFCFLLQLPSLPKQPLQRLTLVSDLEHSGKDVGC